MGALIAFLPYLRVAEIYLVTLLNGCSIKFYQRLFFKHGCHMGHFSSLSRFQSVSAYYHSAEQAGRKIRKKKGITPLY